MLSIIIGAGFSAFETADAATTRTPVRVSTTARRPVTSNTAATDLNTVSSEN